MRVSDTQLTSTYLSNISDLRNGIYTISDQIANQSSILTASDDPEGTAKLLNLNKQLSQSETYLSNIESSLGFVDQTISALDVIESTVSDLMAAFVEINKASIDDYDSYIDQLDAAISTILDAANATYDGKYIFGGTDYSDNPYDLTSDESAVVQNVTDVSGTSQIQVSSYSKQQINVTGDDLFGAIGTDDIFNTLLRIKSDLEAGNLPSDADVEIVNTFYETVLDTASQAGNYYNNLENYQTMLQTQQVNLEEMISSVKDLDLAEAAIILETYNTVLDSVYQVSSMVLPQSLVDFL